MKTEVYALALYSSSSFKKRIFLVQLPQHLTPLKSIFYLMANIFLPSGFVNRDEVIGVSRRMESSIKLLCKLSRGQCDQKKIAKCL